MRMRLLGGGLAARGIVLRLARATGRVRELLARDGVLAALGQDAFYATVREAVVGEHEHTRDRPTAA